MALPRPKGTRYLACALLALALAATALAQTPGLAGDQGDGTYINPILPGDFQNTDVLRVGHDFYYISATKALSPGMTILHSTDLVNWQFLGHVVPDITVFSPRFNFDRMEGPERGIWAGALTFHAGRFFCYFTTPDEGVYVATATNPAGPWSAPHVMLAAPGWDDPGPLWDDDGQPYLALTNFARDPADGKTYHIHLFKMTPDGLNLVPASDKVIHQSHGSEANKLYKIDGLYYHFFSEVTKEGRVPMIGRAKTITGPYETHQILHVSSTTDRSPNQGTLLPIGPDLTSHGKWVFITHHGTSAWEGRPASLLPVTWIYDSQGGWPVPGIVGADNIGTMLWSASNPFPAAPSRSGFDSLPQTDDTFSSPTLGPQWEWLFQPRAAMWSLTERPGFLRLHATKPREPGNLLKTPNILTQRPYAVASDRASVTLDISHMADGQTAGLCLLGKTTASIAVVQQHGQRSIVLNQAGKITHGADLSSSTKTVTLWSVWGPTGEASFGADVGGEQVAKFPTAPFQITSFGSFLGAKIGLFTYNDTADAGYVDIDSFTHHPTARPPVAVPNHRQP
jgi:beta-xylosidase